MRIRRACAPIHCLVLLAITFAWRARTFAADTGAFYVAPDGDDAAAGTPEKPFRTPARARDAIRQGRPADAPTTVYFRGGTYSLTEPLVLTPDDGGTASAPVTYAAYRDEKPMFSGGRAVSGWQKARLNGRDAWVATVKLPAGAAPLRSVWVNDRRAYVEKISGGRLGYVHLADSNRQVPHSGHTDLAGVLRALAEIGYRGYLGMEVVPLPDDYTAAQRGVENTSRLIREHIASQP